MTARLGIPFAPLLMALPLVYVMQHLMGERFSAPIPKDQTWSFFAIFMLAVLSFGYISFFLSVGIWKIATQNLISSAISKTIIERHKLGFSKPLMNLLWRDSFSKNDGG
jgi:hypothetical protein